MSIPAALVTSVLLLVGNAFFVAAEFALVAARRHRLDERAAEGSRAARAAVNGSRELSLMLAGAQLGITLCTLALGALAKPAVAELLSPVFVWTGLPEALSYVVSVVLAVSLVVFLHMVVGEMAPKSWAISHPERSALVLALPFRAFARASRPVLSMLNGCANQLLRLARVEPVESLGSAHTPADLQLLLAQSHEHGVLADDEHRMLTGALRLEDEHLADFMIPLEDAVSVDADASAADVEATSHHSGRSRLLVLEAGRITGLVHVRDAVRCTASAGTLPTVRELRQEALRLPGTLPLIDAVGQLRQHRAQLALVDDGDGQVIGLTALEDILEEILGQFDDETDAQERWPGQAPRSRHACCSRRVVASGA